MKKQYFFDAILVTSTMPAPSIGNESMKFDGGRVYSIRLFDDFEELPVERMFVEQFPDGPMLARFTASPCELIGSLTTRGVCVGLSQQDELLAAGKFMLGPTILRQLTDPTFCVTQSVMVDLLKDGSKLCTVELIVKISATDPDVDHLLLPFGSYDVCRPMEREVNKRDIIFTLGRSAKCGTSTCITDERLMSHAGAPNPCPHAPMLDVDLQGGATPGCGCFVGALKPPDAEKQEKCKERSALKKLVSELGLNEVKVPKPPRTFEKSRSWHSKFPAPSTSSETSSCDPNEFLPERPRRKRKTLSLTASMEQQARRRILGPCPVKEPELKSEPYKPPRLCQLCQSDISWLPKISACPYCGYKTFEDIPSSEKTYDQTATAQQLLRDSLRKAKCERGSSSNEVGKGDGTNDPFSLADDPNIPKQCLCMGGKPCTRCRIRKLCDNFLWDNEVKKQPLPQAQIPAQAEVCKAHAEVPPVSKPHAETARGSKTPAQGQRLSKSQSQPAQRPELKKTHSSTSQRRSQLVSIFTEMRDIYGRGKGAAEADARAEKLRKECNAVCRGTTTSKARRRARRALRKALKEIDKAYPTPTKKRVKKKKVHRRKSKCYTFLKLTKRPTDPRIGHVDCITDGACSGYCKVPCHMGWMWTKGEMARYKSWRPGAIAKPIRQLMAYFLRDFPADNICLSRYHYLNRRGRKDPGEEEEQEELVQHPTLHISRKGDEYIITLRPLKDPKTLAVSANPYADMKPVVFRITKDPTAAALREMKGVLQEKGFSPCTCGRPVTSCYCRSHIDKKRIHYEVEQHCRRRGWPINADSFEYSPDSDDDGSDREYEFGVTPPAGVIKPERVRQPDRAHVETQYEDHDWTTPAMYPHPASMLVQYGACVMGERKRMFPWLLGKGNIHAPPRKPIMKNKSREQPRKKLPFN